MSKIRTAVIFVLTFASMSMALPPRLEVEEWELVSKLCGKLEHTQLAPDKNKPSQYFAKNVPIQDAKLIVYEAPSNTVCCSSVPVAGEMATSKTGSFEFKGLKNGYYWLVAHVDNREYRMSIRIGQLKDRQPVCSEMFFNIDDSGKFTLQFRAPGR